VISLPSLSTICALALDIHIHRLTTRFGKHMRLDNLDQKRRTVVVSGPYTDNTHVNDNDIDDDIEGRHSEAFEVPYAGYGAQNGAAYVDAHGPTKSMQTQGYAVPDGQFGYDTGYHGGHEERALQ